MLSLLLCFPFGLSDEVMGKPFPEKPLPGLSMGRAVEACLAEDSSPAIASCVLYDLGLERQKSARFSSSPFLDSPLGLFPARQDRK